jgi:hypothetical protein
MVSESAVLQDGRQQNMPPVHIDLARLYLGIFSGWAGLEKSPMQKIPAQARPGPTVRPKFSVQARPMEAIFYRAFGPSGQAFLKSHIFLA